MTCCPGGGHYNAAGTHAEREDPVALHLRGEAVGRRRQVPSLGAGGRGGQVVLEGVDKCLRMLHTDAESERLGLQQPSAPMEEAVDIAGGMPRSQHHGDALITVAVGIHHAADALVRPFRPHDKVHHTGGEMILAAISLDGGTHPGDDATETVGAYVGMGVEEDVGVGSMLHKTFQHVAHIATLGAAGIEFAVGIGACTAFSKAPVAVRVDPLLASDGGDVVFALRDVLSPIKDDRPQPHLQSPQGCKETRRTGTHDDDRRTGMAVAIVAVEVGRDILLPCPVDLDSRVIDQPPSARVKAAAQNSHMGEVGLMQREPVGHGTPHEVGRNVLLRGEVYVERLRHG